MKSTLEWNNLWCFCFGLVIVIVLHHSNSISVISWQYEMYDAWDDTDTDDNDDDDNDVAIDNDVAR